MAARHSDDHAASVEVGTDAARDEAAADARAEHVIGLAGVIHRLPAGSAWRRHLIARMRLMCVGACCTGRSIGNLARQEATRSAVESFYDDPAWGDYELDNDDRAQQLAAPDELAALLAATIRALPEYHPWRPSLTRPLRTVNAWTAIPSASGSEQDDEQRQRRRGG